MNQCAIMQLIVSTIYDLASRWLLLDIKAQKAPPYWTLVLLTTVNQTECILYWYQCDYCTNCHSSYCAWHLSDHWAPSIKSFFGFFNPLYNAFKEKLYIVYKTTLSFPIQRDKREQRRVSSHFYNSYCNWNYKSYTIYLH